MAKEEMAGADQSVYVTLLDRTTRNGDRLRIECDPYEPENARSYRVHFLQRGGERALAMLVQRADQYIDSHRRPHREIVFDETLGHRVDIEVLTMQAKYYHHGATYELVEKQSSA